MPSRSTGSQCHAVRIAYALFLACVAIAVIAPRPPVPRSSRRSSGQQWPQMPSRWPPASSTTTTTAGRPPILPAMLDTCASPSMNPTASLARAPYGRLPLRVLVADPL